MSGTAPSSLLVATHELFWRHEPGPGHPERPDRLTAVHHGLQRAGLGDAITWIEPPDAPDEAIDAVHSPGLLGTLRELSAAGGGSIDPDTWVSSDSAAAAVRAAGAGLDLIARLEKGEGVVGWSTVRPPGHHATAAKQMGFCLINNVAVAARFLADRGERVAIVDIDAHHGNGTQDIFYDDPNVLFVSFHQFPWYPYTGRPDEIGEGRGTHRTVNLALPAGATGQVYRAGIETVVAPVMADFDPTWLLLSVGFDAHRADPITDLGLTSADYADVVVDLVSFAPPGRRLLFLEGGYDLQALADSAEAVASVLVDDARRPEEPTSDGPGAEAVEVARRIHVAGRLS
ncbi:MAG: histone deacetylase [Actinomycetia bacterium]|nr:histone deacetylase [Actinomycetes bacterium]